MHRLNSYIIYVFFKINIVNSLPTIEYHCVGIAGVKTERLFSGQGITLIDPDNITITSGKLSLSQITVYQIDRPKKGTWTLTISGSTGGHEFYVKSSSETNVDFEFYFLISLGRRRDATEVPISNPVIGKFVNILERFSYLLGVGKGGWGEGC